MSQKRDLEVYLKEIKQRNIVSGDVLNACNADLTEILTRTKKTIEEMTDANVLRLAVLKWKSQNSDKMKSLKDYSEASSDEFLKDMLCNMILGIYLIFEGKIPRETQLICLWFNIHSKRNILEVKTGEGKTMIVAMTALYYALRGKKIDIFTSSSVLAENETNSDSHVRKYLEFYGISVGNNCGNQFDEKEAEKVYRKQVIYGTSFNFQADYLKKIFSGKVKFFKDRQFDQNHVPILDEVDALLIDRMKDSTRLSSPKPLYEAIKVLLVFIYEVKLQLQNAKNSFGGALTAEILGKKIKISRSHNVQSETKQQPKTFIQKQIEQIKEIVEQGLKGSLKQLFPSYLLENGYIKKMLVIWIANTYKVDGYEQNVNYVISNNQIIPVDLSTGTYQKNTKWADGIHQFVELSNRLEPSVDSLVTNYQSNLIFFQRYKRYLFGLTGTIANTLDKSNAEESIFERFLKNAYELNIYKIPTFQKRLLYIEYPRVLVTTAEWQTVLIQDSKKYSSERQVLIIFKTIKEAITFKDAFKQSLSFDKTPYTLAELYDHDKYKDGMQNLKQLKSKGITENVIIISTNLGGRGTDYQVMSEQIQRKGGIYVMMTYFASNWRIQQQAFGRAGRNGQKGSGAFYLNYQELVSIPEKGQKSIYQNQKQCIRYFNFLTQQRKEREDKEFQLAKIAVNNQSIKRIALDQFKSQFLTYRLNKIRDLEQKIQIKLNDWQDEMNEKYELQMEINLVEEQWGLYLKEVIPSNESQIKIDIDFERFVRNYKSNRQRGNINPGIIAATASRMITFNIKRSKQLFTEASKMNNHWLSMYYLLYMEIKQKVSSPVTKQFAKQICHTIYDIVQIMLVNLCLNSAIRSRFNSTHISGSMASMEAAYTEEINNLCSIRQILDQHVINSNTDKLMYRLTLTNTCHGISELASLGFNKSFKLQFYKVQVEEQEQGFWTWLGKKILKGLKIVAMAVGTVLTGTCMLIATPLIGLVQMLSNKNDQYGLKGIVKAYQQWADMIHKGWKWALKDDDNYKQVQTQIQKRFAGEQKKKLVKIEGQYQLSADAVEKIKAFRAKLKSKAIQQNKQERILLTLLTDLDKITNKEQKQIVEMKIKIAVHTNKEVGATAAETIKIYEQNKEQINKQQNLMTMKIIANQKLNEVVKQGQAMLHQQINTISNQATQKSQRVLDTASTAINNARKTAVNQINSMPTTTNDEILKRNAQVSAFNENIKLDKVQEEILLEKINQEVIRCVKNNTFDIKLAKPAFKIDGDSIFKQIQVQIPLLNEKLKIRSQLMKHEEQYSKHWSQDGIATITEHVNDPTFDKTLRNVSSIILNNKKKQYRDKIMRRCQEGDQKQVEADHIELTKIVNQSNLKTFKLQVTPLSNPSQICQFHFLSEIISNHCLNTKTPCFNLSSEEFMSKILLQKSGQSVFITDGMICFRTEQETIIKVYQKNDSINQSLQKIRCQPKLKIIEENKGKNALDKDVGIQVILDIKNYLNHINCGGEGRVEDVLGAQCQNKIEDEKNDFIKKEYTNSTLLKATEVLLNKSYPEIIQARREKGVGSLPLNFLPVELGVNSTQYSDFINKIMDIAGNFCFKSNQKEFLQNKHVLVEGKNILQKSQQKDIEGAYVDYKKHLQMAQPKLKKIK